MNSAIKKVDPSDKLRRLFRGRGDDAYIGEPVSQTEHALQAAWAAEKDKATSCLIVAALLHDVGHLLHQLPEDCAEHGVDDRHEELGQRFLKKFFSPPVVEPVRLHVAAKRYLCAVEPGYWQALSQASQTSLELQGGPFTPEEVEHFLTLPHAHDAARLRRWDDAAKIESLPTPGLEHFLLYVPTALHAADESDR